MDSATGIAAPNSCSIPPVGSAREWLFTKGPIRDSRRPEDSLLRYRGRTFFELGTPVASAVQGGGTTKFGLNYGAEPKSHVSLIFLIRFDLRQEGTPKPFPLFNRSGWLRQNEYSIGFSFVL